jgi:threonine dehydrogenase-like Zn-dependent dehydrogenase
MAAAEDGYEPAATDELFDFAVVTAPQALDAALALLRPGGTCLVFAAPATPVPVLLDRIYRSELVLVGSRSATPASLREALELIASGRVQVEDLATDVLPLAAFGEGRARYRSRQALKVVFRP